MNNIIGRYKHSLNQDIGWESPYDIKVSYFPIFYDSNQVYVSTGNTFMHNYFIDSGPGRILDQGCNNHYIDNKNITFLPSVNETPFDYKPREQILCSLMPCSGICKVCDKDGKCEHERGEDYGNCISDCPPIPIGGNGTRKYHERCVGTLNETAPDYPALHGCINSYNGDFICTPCGDKICNYGETPCSCPSDCPPKGASKK